MRLTEYLPERLLSPPVEDFEDALQGQADGLNEALLGIMEKELFAHTAESWLPLWEAAYGLDIDPEKPAAERQARLMGKMRGVGTATVELLCRTAASFAGVGCEILEYPREYRFAVRLMGLSSVPASMGDLRAALEELKPAHLAMLFSVLERVLFPKKQETFRVIRLALKAGFSNERRPVVRFDGSERFEGGILFAQGRGIALSKMALASGISHAHRFSGAITIDNQWTFGNGAPFDGRKNFDGGISTETL